MLFDYFFRGVGFGGSGGLERLGTVGGLGGLIREGLAGAFAGEGLANGLVARSRLSRFW